MSSTTSASAAHAIGHDDAAHAALAREHRGREHAGHRAHRAVEAELAEHEQAVEQIARSYMLVGDQDRQRGRQIERAAGLAQIGGREVDGDLLVRHVVTDGLRARCVTRTAPSLTDVVGRPTMLNDGQLPGAITHSTSIEHRIDADERG